MSKKITVSFDAPAGSVPPLYSHYDGQILPQPAYVELNLETGEVDAIVSGEVGNGMPAAVWHGVIRRYPLNNALTSDQIIEAIESVRPALERIICGSDVVMDDQSNWVGRLNEDAMIAEEELSSVPIGADIEASVTNNIAEYLGDHNWPGCSYPQGDQTVNGFISDLETSNGDDKIWFVGDFRDELFDAWLDIVRYLGELPPAVAQAMINDGRFDDSQWLEELTACAKSKTASKETTITAMAGGVFSGQRPIDGWHCLTQDFDFSTGTVADWIENWRGCEEMTNWIADDDNAEALHSTFDEKYDLPALKKGEAIYGPAYFTDDELKEIYEDLKAKQED
jgi:hypothetical protein